MMERIQKITLELGKAPIGKLLWRQGAPAAIGMMVMVFYNIVDTIYVGRVVGPLAIAGIAVVIPISMFVASIGMSLGIGGASIISRALGSNNSEKAYTAFGNLVSLTSISSLVLMVAGYWFANPLLDVFGAKGGILPYARDYFLIILAGAPFLAIAMMANNVIRAEGHARIAMLTMVTSALLNIILDPIFIFGLRWGIKGAAVATVISQFAGFIFIIWHFSLGSSSLKLKSRHLKLDKPIVKETVALGATSLARQGSASLMVMVINNMAFHYGGELAVSIYGILNRVFMFIIFPMLGLVQGFLPVAGFNYGAQKYYRVKESLIVANKTGLLITISGFGIIMLFAPQIAGIFTKDEALITMTGHAIRLLIIAYPLMAFQMLGGAYFQAIGKALPAFIVTISRQGLLLIPLALILPSFIGLDGVWLAFPMADILSTGLTFFMLFPQWKWLGSHDVQEVIVDRQGSKLV